MVVYYEPVNLNGGSGGGGGESGGAGASDLPLASPRQPHSLPPSLFATSHAPMPYRTLRALYRVEVTGAMAWAPACLRHH